MRKLFIGLVLGLGMSSGSWSQTSEELAYRLVDLTSRDAFEDVKKLAFDGINAEGKKDPDEVIFIEEIRNSVNYENLAKLMVDSYTQELSLEELKSIISFYESAPGKKMLNISKRYAKNPMEMMKPIFAEACIRAKSRIRNAGRSTAGIQQVCSQLK